MHDRFAQFIEHEHHHHIVTVLHCTSSIHYAMSLSIRIAFLSISVYIYPQHTYMTHSGYNPVHQNIKMQVLHCGRYFCFLCMEPLAYITNHHS